MSTNIQYTNWSKDQDLVLTSLGDYGYFLWEDFDDESFGVEVPGEEGNNVLAAGATITPPIASAYAVPELELPADVSINTSKLWGRDYVKMEAEFKASAQTSSIPNGILDTQFFSAIKGHYNSITWDFGDGTTSNQANPYHRYVQFEDTEGNDETTDKFFTVTLIVDGPSGNTEVKKVDFIKLIGKA
tara:strand:+ start:668 stop:1228 length:561 start_codon:yes stop_codon:yes gene_type:complete